MTYQLRFFKGIREFARLAVRDVRVGLHICQHWGKSARMAKPVPMARHSKLRGRSPSPTRPCLGLSSHDYTSLSQLPPKVKRKMPGRLNRRNLSVKEQVSRLTVGAAFTVLLQNSGGP
jgi:hypothetical protein